MNSKRFLHIATVILAFAGMRSIACAQYIGPESGQKWAFMGDSITWAGFSHPTGYPHLVDQALQQIGKKIVLIPAGVGGNTSKDMLARFDADIVDKKPDFMTLSCGVNDVLHGATGVPLDGYKQNITAMVAKAVTAGIKVTILTSTPIGEDPAQDMNKTLIGYNDFLRSFAKEKNLPLADLNRAMAAAAATMRQEYPKLQGSLLTVEGVHMQGLGDEIMAAGILKAWGFTDAQLATAKAAWINLPDAIPEGTDVGLSARQYLAFCAFVAKSGKPQADVLNDIWKQALKPLITAPNPNPVP